MNWSVDRLHESGAIGKTGSRFWHILIAPDKLSASRDLITLSRSPQLLMMAYYLQSFFLMASGEWCSLEYDIQKGIVGADTLVKREREVKGDSRAF